MATQLTADDARQSLAAHVAAKGAEIHARYGPSWDLDTLRGLLADRACVRYPCELVFDVALLRPGEFAVPLPRGDRPEDGFTIHVHPCFRTQVAIVPALVLYQLVVVNYGEFASPEDAEIFGAAALGLDREAYYQLLCEAADQISDCPADEGDAPPVLQQMANLCQNPK